MAWDGVSVATMSGVRGRMPSVCAYRFQYTPEVSQTACAKGDSGGGEGRPRRAVIVGGGWRVKRFYLLT